MISVIDQRPSCVYNSLFELYDALPPAPGDPLDMAVGIIDVTPAMAAEWKHKLGLNRNPDYDTVQRYVLALKQGEWRIAESAIMFNGRDNLTNGQHRLEAIMRSGIPMRCIVAVVRDGSIFDNIDAGKPRSYGDSLHIATGVRTNATTVATAARYVMGFQTYGNFDRPTSSRPAPSRPQVNQFVLANPGLPESVRLANRSGLRFAGVSRAVLGALHFLFSELLVSKSEPLMEVASFFDRLADGANLDVDNPILALRNEFQRNALLHKQERHQGYSNNEIAALTVKAWNAYRNGKAIRKLRWSPSGENPEPFPAIK